MMIRPLLLIAAIAVVAVSPGNCWAQSESPVIFVYAAGDQVLAEMLANLIRNDSRIDSEVEILSSPAVIVMATVLPTTECIVIYANHRTQVNGLGPALTTFIEEGGGLIGMTEACYEPSAAELATGVFPVYANHSVQKMSPAEKRVRTYVLDEEHEICEGLPESFELVSMGTYFPADQNGSYVEVPGGYQVAYRDGEVGSPLVTIYETQKGGRSVSFPGIWVVNNQRVDVYYGKLVEDEDFARLLTNSVLWAAKGSTRFAQASKDLSTRIEEAEAIQDRLKEQAERAARKAAAARLTFLAVIWGIGLGACAAIVTKVVLSPLGKDE